MWGDEGWQPSFAIFYDDDIDFFIKSVEQLTLSKCLTFKDFTRIPNISRSELGLSFVTMIKTVNTILCNFNSDGKKHGI